MIGAEPIPLRGALAVTLKELRLLRRDPRLLILQGVAPLVLLLVAGAVFQARPGALPLALDDRRQSPGTRALRRALEASGEVLVTTPQAGADLPTLLLARSAARGSQTLLDGSRPLEARALTATLLGLDQGPSEGAVAVAVWFNPTEDDPTFFVPGTLALILFGMPVMLTATSVVRERTDGTWRTLESLPLGAGAVVVGKLAPATLQGVFIAALVVSAADLIFEVRIQGHRALFAAVTAVFILGSCALGLTISCLARTESQAWVLARVVAVLPAFALSGFVFPLQALPPVARGAAQMFPLRPYLELTRGVMVRGASPLDMPSQVEAVAVFALSMTLVSAALLRRQGSLG